MSGEFFNSVAISLLVLTPNLNQVMFLLASSHKPNLLNDGASLARC